MDGPGCGPWNPRVSKEKLRISKREARIPVHPSCPVLPYLNWRKGNRVQRERSVPDRRVYPTCESPFQSEGLDPGTKTTSTGPQTGNRQSTQVVHTQGSLPFTEKVTLTTLFLPLLVRRP